MEDIQTGGNHMLTFVDRVNRIRQDSEAISVLSANLVASLVKGEEGARKIRSKSLDAKSTQRL